MPQTTKLTSLQVREIYSQKLMLQTPHDFRSCLLSERDRLKGQSERVSQQYGVNAKTIRDIWNRKRWIQHTCSLWHMEHRHATPYEHFITEYAQRHTAVFDAIPHDAMRQRSLPDPFHDDWAHWGS